jgi:hypothetical protein
MGTPCAKHLAKYRTGGQSYKYNNSSFIYIIRQSCECSWQIYQFSNRGIGKKQWSWMNACLKAEAVQIWQNKQRNEVCVFVHGCVSPACPPNHTCRDNEIILKIKKSMRLSPLWNYSIWNGDQKRKSGMEWLLIHVDGDSRIEMICHQPPHSRIWFAK